MNNDHAKVIIHECQKGPQQAFLSNILIQADQENLL